MGNRIYKQIDNGTSVTEKKYIVDVVGKLPTILLEIQPGVDDLFGTADDSIGKTYMYANSQIIAQHNGSHEADLYFYLHDRLGSVREIIDTSADVQQLYTYDPFGDLIESDGSFDNPFMFTGQWYDDEIDQYYLRARMYDPVIMRFTGRDPVNGEFTEPMILHKYLYCLNNPINGIDPQGLWTIYVTGSAMGTLGSWGGVRQSGIVFDDKGNVGWINITGWQGGVPSASIGVSVGWTNAEEIYDLAGVSNAIGGSLPIPWLPGTSGGLEYLVGAQRSGELYHGVEVNLGYSTSLPEFHDQITYTTITPMQHIMQGAGASAEFLFESVLSEAHTLGEGYLVLYSWAKFEENRLRN